MNKKDLNEIRRRFQVDRNNISRLQGCYVNSQGEAVSVFADTLIGMPKEEAEKYLALFKKALSGTEDQNLRNIDFDPERMADSEAYHLLCSMKDTALKDDEVVNEFFRRVMAATPLNEPYLILLAHDGYDIPCRHSDGHPAQDAPTEIFHYIVGCICPVKMTKPALCYDAGENIFRSKEADWVVNAPEIGFMFPAFESRSVNVCRALYYTRNTASNHEELTGALFDASLSMPAAAQKEAFQQIMQDTLGDECSYEVMQAVHEQVMEKIEERKAEKNPEPVRVNRYDMTDMLKECGVSEEKQAAFAQQFEQHFGEKADVAAANIVSPKQFEVRTPSVQIRVAPERSDLVETRQIDGHTYILIRADEGQVEVNGVNVRMQ